DRALRAVAAALSLHARPQDHGARFGGEEICLLVPGLDEPALNDYLEQLRTRGADLREPGASGDLRLTVSICAGLAPPGGTLHSLLAEADRRLYLAKAGGRNQVVDTA